MADVRELQAIAERLGSELTEKRKADMRIHPSHLAADLLEGVSERIGGFGVEGVLDEEKGIDLMYVNMGDAYNLTVLYDGKTGKFLASAWGDIVEEKEREYEQAERDPEKSEPEPETGEDNRDEEIAAFLAAIKSGDSVYIGEREYYVHSANRFHANLYAMDELDALPDEMTLFEDHPPYKKEELLKDAYGLTLGVRKNALPVTDYFMDIRDLRDTAVSNPRNSDLIRNMGLEVPEKDNPIIPMPQTNASPYYSVGDAVHLKGEEKVRIHAIGNINVWYSIEGDDPGEIQRLALRDFNRDFFNNRRNDEIIERGKAIEQSGDGHTGKFPAESRNDIFESQKQANEKKKAEMLEHGEKAYDINYGHLGNGLTVWNRLEERDGDYVTVAHIGPDRSVTFRDENLPDSVKEQILDIARTSDAKISATQDTPVFDTPPQEKNQEQDIPTPEPGKLPVFYGPPEENSEAYWKSNELNHECVRALGKAFSERYNNNRLDMDGLLEDVKAYGSERISVVLANTMRYREGDGRFSAENWKWQKNVALPESALTHYTGVSSHSILVNHLVTAIRELEKNKERGAEMPQDSPPPTDAAKKPEPETVKIESGNQQPEPDITNPADTSPRPAKSILGELDWPKPRNKTEEYRQEFTKKIISLMEQGEAFWQQPWKSPDTVLPYNAKTGNRYNGVNIAYLMVSSIKQGFSDPRWMTYKQAQEEGYQVRSGEHGTRIEFYSEYDPSKTKKGAEAKGRMIREMMESGLSREEIDKAMEDQKIFIVKTYTVFNASQIEGIEPLETDMSGSENEFRYHGRAESIMDNCGVPIRYGTSGAAYNISQDIINMPNREWFSTPEHFYATVLHEIAHSTGHPSRMNRDSLGHPFGSPEYAMEELRAEMASAFVFQEIGMPLSSEDMEGYVKDHAAYTQHWLGRLKEDYKEFYTAVRDAAKIADYTLAYEKTLGKTKDSPAITGDAPKEPEAAAATKDPVMAAKALIGERAIVTNAQRGKTYTGEILMIDGGHAIQRTGPNRGIIHSLGKFGDPSPLSDPPDKRAKVSISYDGEMRASLKTAPREEERETSATR